jgi:hypothetical protein
MIQKIPLIDLARINEINKIDPTGHLLKYLVKIFHLEVLKSIKQIHDLQKDCKYKDILSLSHRLCSTCYNLGANNVAKLFKQIELLSDDENIDKILLSERISLLPIEFQKSSIELDRIVIKSAGDNKDGKYPFDINY